MKGKNKIKLIFILIVFALAFSGYAYLIRINARIKQENIRLEQELTELKAGKEENQEDRVAEITEVSFESISGEDLYKDGWVTIGEDNRVRIKIKIKGESTSLDMFIAPTGTETYLLQEIIDSIIVSPGQKELEYTWDVPEGTMGHFWIIAYNNNIGQKSQTFNIYNE